jgi:hypothetical protein
VSALADHLRAVLAIAEAAHAAVVRDGLDADDVPEAADVERVLAAAREALARDVETAGSVCHADDGMIECPMPAHTGEWIAIADGPHMHDDEGLIAWAHPARAARIVTCVNACAGIEDPAGMVQALRDAADWIDDYVTEDIGGRDYTRAAIRRALGGAA